MDVFLVSIKIIVEFRNVEIIGKKEFICEFVCCFKYDKFLEK